MNVLDDLMWSHWTVLQKLVYSCWSSFIYFKLILYKVVKFMLYNLKTFLSVFQLNISLIVIDLNISLIVIDLNIAELKNMWIFFNSLNNYLYLCVSLPWCIRNNFLHFLQFWYYLLFSLVKKKKKEQVRMLGYYELFQLL